MARVVAKEVVILGGGISGLATAWGLVRAAALRTWSGAGTPPPNITIVEAAPKLGGQIETHRGPNNTVLETGPRGLRPSGHQGRATLNLIASLGLEDEVLVAGKDHPGAAKRFVYTGGNLVQLPTSATDLLKRAVTGDFLSQALLKGVVGEPFSRKSNPKFYSSLEGYANDDESVFEFAQRRLGNDVATYMIDPLCVGIFGGDARKLSLKSCFPSLAEFEDKEGSLMLGAIRADVNAEPLPSPEPGTQRLLDRVDGARVWTLQDGLSTLVDGLHDWLASTASVTIKTGTLAKSVGRDTPGKVRVVLSDGTTINADHVVSTLPATQFGSVIKDSDQGTAAILDKFTMQSIVVTNFLFKGDLLPAQGFGYLVPTTEPDNDILGVVFDSCAFPQQDDPYVLGGDLGTTTRVTVMSGGYKQAALYGDGAVDDELAIDISLKALQRQIGVTATPIHTNVRPWMNCSAQYNVGHANRCTSVRDSFDQGWNGMLSVTGASYSGVGVNDCILNATKLAGRLIDDNLA